jgi:hypothetical protein
VNDASVRPKETRPPRPSVAIARPKRLTTVVVDPQLVPIPDHPSDPDHPDATPDAAQAAGPLTLDGEMLIDPPDADEASDEVTPVPRRIAAGR